MQLPKIPSQDPVMQLMQTKWASILNPLLAQPLSSNAILNNITLKTGDNVINHLLARTMQGWIISDINAACTIYRTAPFNSSTLTLNASAPCVVDLVVF
jgi:hypothetical protein